MAYDKVVDSEKLDAAMAATANAIREKGGTDDSIAWDETTGFADAVSEIEAGGGGGGGTSSNLPDGYVPLEYLAAGNDRYIDTGYTYKADPIPYMELDIEIEDVAGPVYLFGVRDGEREFSVYITGNRITACNAQGEVTSVTADVSMVGKWNVYLGVDTVYFSGENETAIDIPLGEPEGDIRYKIALLGMNNEGVIEPSNGIKLYRAQFGEDSGYPSPDAIWSEWQPALEVSSGKVGLYDTLNEKFHPANKADDFNSRLVYAKDSGDNYLQAGEREYIDTDYYLPGDETIEIDVWIPDTEDTVQLFGAASLYYGTCYLTITGRRIYLKLGDTIIDEVADVNMAGRWQITIHPEYLSFKRDERDEEELMFVYGHTAFYLCDVPIWLFGINDVNGVMEDIKCSSGVRFYSFKTTYDDEVCENIYPAISGDGKTIGMYASVVGAHIALREKSV